MTGLITTSNSICISPVSCSCDDDGLYIIVVVIVVVGLLNSEHAGKPGARLLGTRVCLESCCTELICHWVSSTNRPQAHKCLSNMVSVGQLPGDSHAHTPAVQQLKMCNMGTRTLFLSSV